MIDETPIAGEREAIHSHDGAVIIPFPLLQTNPMSLKNEIEEAFGSDPKCLGIIIISDLPSSFVNRRERLLKLGYRFSQLEETTREKYADPLTKYSFGWSHGKEIMNGKIDLLKGSYYANPIIDIPKVSAQEHQEYPEYYGSNIWPDASEKGIEGFEEAFKDMGQFIFKVGCKLAEACQLFVPSNFGPSKLSLTDMIRTSQTTKARLLHYFPPELDFSADDPVDSWCGFHLDHSLLTGLCSAMYLESTKSSEPRIIMSPSPNSGLFVRTRGGDLKKVSIPGDSLAFQMGEALELISNGRLCATPHCVRVGLSTNSSNVSRETFVLFMQPDTKHYISGSKTFGNFTKEILKQHYD